MNWSENSTNIREAKCRDRIAIVLKREGHALGRATNRSISGRFVLLIAFAVYAQPVIARTYLNCPTRKVVIVSAPSGNTQSSSEELLGFWVDDAAKILTFADGAPLTVRRFDDRWISAVRGDVSYEFHRQAGVLTYVTSITKDDITTIVIGSGRCKPASASTPDNR